jgi:Amt family ammonium transporter
MSMAAQIKVQVIGIAAIALFTAVMTGILLKIIDATLGLRVGAEEETMGLDLVLHDERGYNL